MTDEAATPARGLARPLRSVGARVALVSILSAALGGLAAATLAIVGVDRLIAEQADQRLLAATVTLAGELDEDLDEDNPEALTETIEDENGEIVTSGIRLAVFAGGRLAEGDPWMIAPPAGSCESHRVGKERVRFCARAYPPWVLVAAQPIDEQWLRWVYALAALTAVVLGAGTGALSSRTLSRWAVGSVTSLAHNLRQLQPGAPGALDLGPAGDCEEVEKVRTALLELTTRLHASLEQAQRFAADAAHELRTPLTALRAELELLAEEASGEDRAALESASARVVRLSELVERLLVLALPTDHVSRGFETLSVADVLEEVVDELPAERRARLDVQLDGEALIRGDARLISALIRNALENAFKFAPEGPVHLTVRDDSDGGQSGREVRIDVRDHGPGVPAALRERVFEPFYRATSVGPGHGLGLALIGHIARAHGGRAYFQPSDEGAHLVVELPPWTPRP